MTDRNEPSTIRLLYLSAVLELFDLGLDTWEISKTLKNQECMVERALHEALTMRRNNARNIYRPPNPDAAC
jgi:hypothetical protein